MRIIVDVIGKLSLMTAKYLANNITDTTDISKIIQAHKKREELTILTKDEVVEIFDYGLKAIYGEIFKLIIIFIVAGFLHILIPTLIISLVFSTLRLVAGGAHMSTFNKCLITTSALFLGLGYFTEHIHNKLNEIGIIIFISFTFIFSIICSIKWSPRDNVNKEITNINEIRKFKKLTIIYIIISTVLTIGLNLLNAKMIIVAICSAIILEIITITPLGVKIFELLDKEAD